MSTVYSVKLQQIIDEFQLEKIFLPDDENIIVTRSDLNRPGLALSGFFGHFEPARIQLIGNCEHTYLNSFPESYRFIYVKKTSGSNFYNLACYFSYF